MESRDGGFYDLLRRSLAILFLVGVFCLQTSASEGGTALPDSYLAKVDSIPDFPQVPPGSGRATGRASQFCGPAAVTNVLVWLDNNGFPDMVPGVANASVEYKLMKYLGQDSFMKVGKTGSSPSNVMSGLYKYCRQRGYRPLIEWRGWRKGGPFKTSGVPDLRWLFAGSIGTSNVILNIGFYRYEAGTDTYSRISGHFVTMVGYEGAYGANPKIIIHDPSLRSGRVTKHEYCRLVLIRSGTFAKWKKYGVRSAAGWHVVDGIALKKGADCAVLDGAFGLGMRR